jgi:hypothetical protein
MRLQSATNLLWWHHVPKQGHWPTCKEPYVMGSMREGANTWGSEFLLAGHTGQLAHPTP